jgi:DMSO reductase anchor subunit
MSRVYRLPAAPGWNTWRTNAGFLVSALLLGEATIAALLAYEAKHASVQIPSGLSVLINGSMLILLLVQLGLMRRHAFDIGQQNARRSFIFCGVALTLSALLFPRLNAVLVNASVLIFVLAEEGLGRWLFYRSRLDALSPSLRGGR